MGHIPRETGRRFATLSDTEERSMAIFLMTWFRRQIANMFLMRKVYWIVAAVMIAALCFVGCAPDAALQGSPEAGESGAPDGNGSEESAESAQPSPLVGEEMMLLDQDGQILGLHYKYSSNWEKIVDKDNTVSFRIPGTDGDYYAVVTGETMDFSHESDPEAARQNWARNAVDFMENGTVITYTLGSPSYYYYDLKDGVETIGVLFFNGNDFYELQCQGPGGDDASMLGVWTDVIDGLTLD